MKTINLVALIDGLLEDYVSPAKRRIFHAIVSLVVGLVAIWLAAEGDWSEALIALGAAVYAAGNKANTKPDPVYEGGGDNDLYNR